jgi:hypothetical protein
MDISHQRIANQERVVKAANGWLMLGLLLALATVAVAGIPYGAVIKSPAIIIVSAVLIAVTAASLTGLFTLQPNEARVLVLFGQYIGTVRESGLHWANPFYSNGVQLNVKTAQDLVAAGRAAGATRSRCVPEL